MALAGGFIPYSPPPSSVASSSATFTLPQPRKTPLKAGGNKESSFIRYVDQQILHIQRRFAKRDASGQSAKDVDDEGRVMQEVGAKKSDWNDVPGYASFGAAAKDVEQLVDVIWVSGTPSLQIPYLTNLAFFTSTMIPAYPAAPRPLFRILDKFDHAFASLLQGSDVETGEPLPGFSTSRRGVSGTDKVRIKSLVERTRVYVAEAMSKGEFEEDDESPPDTDIEGDLILDEPADLDVDEDGEVENWQMRVARVYDKTLVEIGDSMGGEPIGIRTEQELVEYRGPTILMEPKSMNSNGNGKEAPQMEAKKGTQAVVKDESSLNGPRV